MGCRPALALSAVSSFVRVSVSMAQSVLSPHGPHRAGFPQWVLQARLPAPAQAFVSL